MQFPTKTKQYDNWQVNPVIEQILSNDKNTFNVLVDKEILNKLINSPITKAVKVDRKFKNYYGDAVLALKKIRAKLNKNNELQVKYVNVNSKTKKKSKIPIGRVVAENYLSLSPLPRKIRHTLCGKYYLDFDLESCHPNIVYQLCQKIDYSVPNELKEYVENREQIIREMVYKHWNINEDNDDYSIKRKLIKELYLILLNGGTIDTWLRDNNIQDIKKHDIDNRIEIFAKQAKAIRDKVSSQNQWVKKYLTEDDKKDVSRSIFSYVVCEHERRIVEVAIVYLINAGYVTNNCIDYAYDGFMTLKQTVYDKLNQRDMTLPELLLKIQKVCFDFTGFNIKWTTKPLDYNLLTEIDDFENKEYSFDETYTNSFDNKYFETLQSYDERKAYFELFNFQILHPPQYIYTGNVQISEQYNNGSKVMEGYEQKIFRRYELKHYNSIYKTLKSGEFNNKGDETKFLDKWVNDCDKRQYTLIDYYPFNTINVDNNDKQLYNIFNGYDNRCLTPFDKNKIDDILKPFFIITRALFNGDDRSMMLGLHVIAHLIQKPSKKIGYCLIMKGQQGEGKNVFLNCIRNVIGKDNFLSTSKATDVFGEYGEMTENKLLINLNEMNLSDTKTYGDRLKNLITEDEITVNPKYEARRIVNNYSLIVITTNNNVCVPIDAFSGDRRFIVVKGTGVNKQYTRETWGKFVNYFEKDQFIAALYHYFNTLDVDNYNFHEERNYTKTLPAYKNMINHFFPNDLLFIRDFIEKSLYHPLGILKLQENLTMGQYDCCQNVNLATFNSSDEVLREKHDGYEHDDCQIYLRYNWATNENNGKEIITVGDKVDTPTMFYQYKGFTETINCFVEGTICRDSRWKLFCCIGFYDLYKCWCLENSISFNKILPKKQYLNRLIEYDLGFERKRNMNKRYLQYTPINIYYKMRAKFPELLDDFDTQISDITQIQQGEIEQPSDELFSII